MEAKKTGWERDKRTHFNEIVAAYDRVRPGYPQALYEDVFAYSNAPIGKTAIEIGAGTGKATQPFLDAGYAVTAVEIGANMADFLSKRFAAYKGFDVVVSSFEDAALQENGYDLLYAASAFHWVDASIGCPKAYRLLKKGGAIALFRYNVIAAVGDALYEEIQSVYEKHYYSHYTAVARPNKKTREDFLNPSEIYVSYRFEDLRDYGFKDVSMKFYDGEKTYTADEYIDWLKTMSDHRSLPEDNQAALYSGVREAIMKYGNRHSVAQIYQLYMGKK